MVLPNNGWGEPGEGDVYPLPSAEWSQMTRSKDKMVVVPLAVGDVGQAFAFDEEDGGHRITLNVRSPELTTATDRVVLIVGDAALLALGLGRSLGRSGDLDTKVRFTHLFELNPPVTVQELTGQIKGSTVRSKATECLLSGGVIPQQTELALLEALVRLRPEVASALRGIRAAIGGQNTVSTKRHRVLAEQRDALALGLEIAGFDSRLIVPDAVDADVPFLSGLDEGGTSEAAIIRHDAAHFDGWSQSDAPVHDVVTFQDPTQPRRKVTVVYVDKEPLEELTGTDLIYYRSTNPGFALVQYKRMERLSGSHAVGEWGYRPDGQLEKDFERMRKWISEDREIVESEQWRLSQEPFYFKLVENSMRRPHGHKLVKGMYFPRTLFEILQNSDQIIGPRGGKIIGWNCGRYMEKDEFVSLLQRGWIGSTADVTERLTTIVREALQRKRGVVMVRDETDPETAKQHRKHR